MLLYTTNSEIERGVICMKRIKTDFRNELIAGNPESNDNISEWRPNESYNHWNSTNDL